MRAFPFCSELEYNDQEMASPQSQNRITYFAVTDTRNRRVPFGIKATDRTRHMYVIGKTGMGKSTLLENMAIQDIQNGEGLAFIDPHGKSADLLLDYIPEDRIKDVLYFAPFDMEYPISFNIMEDIGPDKRHLVVAGLMSTFKKIWVDAWSARMEYILQNTLLALLEYPDATLLGVNKVLSDKEYRKKVVDNIKDPATRSFWVDEFAKYTDRFAAEAVPAIQNKVGQFTSNPLIRNILGQPKSSFDLRKIIDEKKIMIVNLSKGLVGEGNANLLGSMLITKIYLAALSRADQPESVVNKLPNFYLYVDEFQSFANESFADILSEARKYKLNLTMAHQYIEQMPEEVRAAVFGNVGTMISFRVGAFDAEILEKEFSPQFTAEDLVNLGFTQIYLKLMIDGVSSPPFSATTTPPIPKPPMSYRDSVISQSRLQFGHMRAHAEQEIVSQLSNESGGGKSTAGPDRKPTISNEQAQQLKSVIAGRAIAGEGRRGGDLPDKQAGKADIQGLRSALASVLTDEELPPVQARPPVREERPSERVQSIEQREATPTPRMREFDPMHSRRAEVERGSRDSHYNQQRSHGDRGNDRFRENRGERPPRGEHRDGRRRTDVEREHRDTPPIEGEKNVSLKEALGDILKNLPKKPGKEASSSAPLGQNEKQPVSSPHHEEKQVESKPPAETPVSSTGVSPLPKHTDEIPEEQLRKMLEIER
jgi:hypothetical protein